MNQIGLKTESPMLSTTSTNQNLTKFPCMALSEKAGLSQPTSTCLLGTSYLTQLKDFPVRKVTLL